MEETKVKRGRPKTTFNLEPAELKELIREVLKEELEITQKRLYSGLVKRFERDGVLQSK